MPSRRVINRLKLGPIVGHTDETNTCVWIQVFDDPELYQLHVKDAGSFPFESTETRLTLPLEFRTAIASATGLRPDWRYNYKVLRRGRSVRDAKGTFRTMPRNGSMANILFCAVSCNAIFYDNKITNGAWEALNKFVKEAKPHFIIMMGDQLYIDEDKNDIFGKFRETPSLDLRKALAEKYLENWSRKIVKDIMANVPIYMMWDDHEIRDGWGSLASDSETLLEQYPRGKEIFNKCKTYFENTRDLYWHFQGCHNPQKISGQLLPNYIDSPPRPNDKFAMPYVFQCGRLIVLVLDSRGERDVFRKELPILGPRQWQFIHEVFDNLADDVDAFAVVTPTPIASLDPEGQTQKLMGERMDDVESFKKGDFKGLFDPIRTEGGLALLEYLGRYELRRVLGGIVNQGTFETFKIDEVRDQWSHRFSRKEQIDLLKAAGDASFTNRQAISQRALVFVSGDIHIGCIFDITSSKPSYKAVSITSSGVSTVATASPTVGAFVDEDFNVASGIRSTLRDVVRDFNFGVIQVVPTGSGAEMVHSLAHEGNSYAVGLNIKDLL
jgi:hypothetical protein